jgi:hypothetical protein
MNGTDFRQLAETNLTFHTDGQKEVFINILDDETVENDEQFLVSIKSLNIQVTDAKLFTSNATVTILDDDCKYCKRSIRAATLFTYFIYFTKNSVSMYCFFRVTEFQIGDVGIIFEGCLSSKMTSIIPKINFSKTGVFVNTFLATSVGGPIQSNVCDNRW